MRNCGQKRNLPFYGSRHAKADKNGENLSSGYDKKSIWCNFIYKNVVESAPFIG
jgi:hypothetical protein